jgi:hypothetical protein
LLDFPVVLLDFPTDAANIFYGDGRILREIIGYDIFRAVSCRYPKQFYLAIVRKFMDFDNFATQPL